MLSKPGMFDAPSVASASSPLEDYIQPTLNHGLRVWWAYYWPTTLIILAISLNVAFFLGIFVATGALSPSVARTVAVWQTYLWMFIVSFFTIRYILGKRLRNFRIALLANAGSGAANPLPRTLHRTLRVWWAFIWRVIVFSVIVRIAGSIALGSIVAILSATGRAMAVLMPLIMQVAIDAAVGLFVMYSAILDEQFGDFRVALLPRKDAAPAVAPAPSSPPTLQPQ
jgi:hypothetical protein